MFISQDLTEIEIFNLYRNPFIALKMLTVCEQCLAKPLLINTRGTNKEYQCDDSYLVLPNSKLNFLNELEEQLEYNRLTNSASPNPTEI